jgi:hypothetical protein
MVRLTTELLENAFDATEQKVVGTSHSGRMMSFLEQMGIQITTSRRKKLMSFYRNANRGIDLSKY